MSASRPDRFTPRGRMAWYALVGLQIMSERFVKELNFLPVPGVEPRFLGRRANNVM
jgi:hypothetical protein